MLTDELSTCLKCKVPRCRMNCPVATPIPEVITLVQEGREEEAARMLFENNPLSAVCAIVCPHERNCRGHCIRGIKGQPVPFHRLEQELSRRYLENYTPPDIVRKPCRIAVVGAGPAGITMSILLSLNGFRVTLIDARNRVGGVLRYGIPEFRLPRAVIDHLGGVLHRLGVKFKPNIFIGSTITLDDMFIDGYSAIFIAVGTAKPNRLGLLGETLGHVHYAIDYLKSPEAYRPGPRVVVVGAGNVALDAARMAARTPGVTAVTVINNRREADMTGNRREIAEAQAEGVQFRHLLQTIQIEDDGAKCAAVAPVETAGGVVYEEDFSRIEKIPADTVILAIGQGPQGAVITASGISQTRHGLLDVDENGHTTKPGVFAAGDIVTGPKTVVEAVAFSKKVAPEIMKYCAGLPPRP